MSDSAERLSVNGNVDGLSNFRDFGGLRVKDGGRIAARRFFRSAAPGGISAKGVDDLARHEIATIIDLRGQQERLKALLPDYEAIRVVSVPVEPGTSGVIQRAFADGTATRAGMRDLMIASYRAYVAVHAEAFGAALATMVQSDGPSMVHCTAGKDRTGFLVALLQRAFGVADHDVIADYLRTNTDWDRASIHGHLPADAEEIVPILVADVDYLDAAFADIARIDGSIEAFMARATAGRVSRDQIHRFIEQGSSV